MVPPPERMPATDIPVSTGLSAHGKRTGRGQDDASAGVVLAARSVNLRHSIRSVFHGAKAAEQAVNGLFIREGDHIREGVDSEGVHEGFLRYLREVLKGRNTSL